MDYCVATSFKGMIFLICWSFNALEKVSNDSNLNVSVLQNPGSENGIDRTKPQF
jgi:hypothetical protein